MTRNVQPRPSAGEPVAIAAGVTSVFLLALLATAAIGFSLSLHVPFSTVKWAVAAQAAGLLVPALAILTWCQARSRSLVIFVSASLLLAAAALVSGLLALNTFEWQKGTAFLAGCIGAGLASAASATVLRERWLSSLAAVAAACTFVASLYGIIQRLHIEPLIGIFSRGTASVQPGYPGSFFGNANFAAAFIAPAAILALFLSTAQSPARWLARLAYATACLYVAVAGSRGGLLAFVAGSAVWLAIRSRDCGLRRLLPTATIVAAVLAVAIIVSGTASRFAPSSDSPAGNTLLYRWQIWKSTASMIRAKPLTGVGYWNLDLVIPRYSVPGMSVHQDAMFANERVNRAHNDYLDILAETGVVGVGALFAAVAAAWLGIRHALRRGDPAAAALAGAISAILAHALVDFPLYLGASGLLFWCLLGAAAAHQAPSILSARPVTWRAYAALAAAILLALTASHPWRTHLAASAAMRRAETFTGANRHSDAAETLRQAAPRAPYEREIWARLTVAEEKAGNFQRAAESARRWVALEPNLADAHNHLGYALTRTIQPGPAARAFQEAFRLAPDRLAPRLNLAALAFESADYASAYRHYAVIAEKSPAAIRDNLRPYALSAGHAAARDEAIKILEDYLRQDPADAEAATLLEKRRAESTPR